MGAIRTSLIVLYDDIRRLATLTKNLLHRHEVVKCLKKFIFNSQRLALHESKIWKYGRTSELEGHESLLNGLEGIEWSGKDL